MQEVQYTIKTLHQKSHVKLLLHHSRKDVLAPHYSDDFICINSLHFILPSCQDFPLFAGGVAFFLFFANRLRKHLNKTIFQRDTAAHSNNGDHCTKKQPCCSIDSKGPNSSAKSICFVRSHKVALEGHRSAQAFGSAFREC